MRFLHFARSLALAASLCVAAVSPAHAEDVGTLTPGKIVAGVDAVHPPEVGRQLAEILPDAQLVELAGVPLDRHEAAITAAFLDHLSRLRAKDMA